MNIQELQFISQHNLPIAIVLINNHSSGMIKDREKASGYNYSLHTTIDSGYGFPNFSKVADNTSSPTLKTSSCVAKLISKSN